MELNVVWVYISYLRKKLAALRAELDGVVEQVVDDLRDAVALGLDPDGPVGQLDVDVQALAVDLLLERDDHVAHQLAEVEPRHP